MLERVCGHTCALNSKALEVLGITKDTPIDVYEGGTVEKDDAVLEGLYQEGYREGERIKAFLRSSCVTL